MVTEEAHDVMRGMGRIMRSGIAVGVMAAVFLTLGACATRPAPADTAAVAAFKEANDPIEPLNRYFFAINNQLLDPLIIKPLAQGYDIVLPRVVKDSIRNFLDNLDTPVILANDLLQGEWGRAGTTLTRFGINTTVGIAGLFDPAERWGYQQHSEDFGQTLAVWGSGEGPYIFLPFLGPSPPRDIAGFVVDRFFDPFTYISFDGDTAFAFARLGAGGIDRRARVLDTLDDIERTSLDYYAAVRSLYRQNRNNSIANGRFDPAALPDISDIDYDFDTDIDAPDAAPNGGAPQTTPPPESLAPAPDAQGNNTIETQPAPASGLGVGT